MTRYRAPLLAAALAATVPVLSTNAKSRLAAAQDHMAFSASIGVGPLFAGVSISIGSHPAEVGSVFAPVIPSAWGGPGVYFSGGAAWSGGYWDASYMRLADCWGPHWGPYGWDPYAFEYLAWCGPRGWWYSDVHVFGGARWGWGPNILTWRSRWQPRMWRDPFHHHGALFAWHDPWDWYWDGYDDGYRHGYGHGYWDTRRWDGSRHGPARGVRDSRGRTAGVSYKADPMDGSSARSAKPRHDSHHSAGGTRRASQASRRPPGDVVRETDATVRTAVHRGSLAPRDVDGARPRAESLPSRISPPNRRGATRSATASQPPRRSLEERATVESSRRYAPPVDVTRSPRSDKSTKPGPATRGNSRTLAVTSGQNLPSRNATSRSSSWSPFGQPSRGNANKATPLAASRSARPSTRSVPSNTNRREYPGASKWTNSRSRGAGGISRGSGVTEGAPRAKNPIASRPPTLRPSVRVQSVSKGNTIRKGATASRRPQATRLPTAKSSNRRPSAKSAASRVPVKTHRSKTKRSRPPRR